MNKNVLNLGFWAAIICLSSFIIWTISFVGIVITSPLYMWTNLEEYISFTKSNSQFFQYLAKSFMIVFALSYLVLVAVFQEIASAEKRIFAKIAVLFGLMFALLASIHYFVQISTIRFAFQANDFEGIEHFLQAKPTSFLASINVLGWTFFLGLSSLFLIFSFKTKEVTKGIKIGLFITTISCLISGLSFLFQIDIITFFFLNLGLGGGMLFLTISASRYFTKLKKII